MFHFSLHTKVWNKCHLEWKKKYRSFSKSDEILRSLCLFAIQTVIRVCQNCLFPEILTVSRNHHLTPAVNDGRRTYNPRLIESLLLEGTFEGHPVQLPCNEQGPAQPDQLPRAWSSLAWMSPEMGHPPPCWATCSSADNWRDSACCITNFVRGYKLVSFKRQRI